MDRFTLSGLALVAVLYLQAQHASDPWVFHQQEGDGWFGAIAEDNFGNIVVGGGGGNSHFRIFDGTDWTLYRPADFGVSFGFYGRELTVDSNNVIWLAQGNQDGLSSWDGTNLVNYNTSNSGITSNSVFGVGVDRDNVIWHTRFQSFDGDTWSDFFAAGCSPSQNRHVFVSAENEVWMTGVPSVGIETGTVGHPCVSRIRGGEVTHFNFAFGDNLPELTAFYGGHLMEQLSDGTLFVVGKTATQLELKRFDGVAWQDWMELDDDQLATSSFWGVWVKNDVIWLGGKKDNETSQILKYCDGEWTIYNLPESQNFPNAIYEIMVDSNDQLWIVGNAAIASLPLPPEDCTNIVNGVQEVPAVSCRAIRYQSDGELFFVGCPEDLDGAQYQLYNSAGQIYASGTLTGLRHRLGIALPAGIYYIRLVKDRQVLPPMQFVVH